MNGLITGRNEAVGAESLKQRVVSAAATLTPEDRVVLVDCSATFTLTLCPVSECPGALIYIKGFGTGGAVTIATPTGGMLATPKFTVDDLTAATDYKLILNVHGVDYMELAEVTT